MARKSRRNTTDWDGVAAWYDGWVGKKGSYYHRRFALPALLRLLKVRAGERILDIGCGQGVLAPAIARAGAAYTGVDASAKLLELARRRHPQQGRFVLGDAQRLEDLPALRSKGFDAAIFLLSLQNMEKLEEVLRSTSRMLKTGGRVVLLLTHPCFRLPRQSGWGWDAARRLQYRRVDRYLTPFNLSIRPSAPGECGSTVSFHRPLTAYVNGLGAAGLAVDQVQEIPAQALPKKKVNRAEQRAHEEIPLFLAIRARKTPMNKRAE